MKTTVHKIKTPEGGLILLLALLPGLFFWRLLTPYSVDRMQIAAGDFTEQYYPLRALTARLWAQGQIPLWNPYLYGGQPALADIQSGALYPPHVIQGWLFYYLAPFFGWETGFPIEALQFQVIVHFSLAAVGTYLLVRQLMIDSTNSIRSIGRIRLAALISALVFTYSGYLTGFPVQQITILEVSAWLSWLLWGLTLASRSWRATAWAALFFAMAILAGHPQTMLYIFYLSLAYALFLGWQSFYRWILIVSLGAALAAPQWLPTLEFIDHSLRADLSYSAVSTGLPLNELIAILYPGFLGGSPEYVGLAPLVLIGLALTLRWPSPHRIYFWFGVGLISLLLAFGGHTFLYSPFYLLIPGFKMVRQQERAFLLYSFSAAVLAGYGTLALTGPLSPSIRDRYYRFEHILKWILMIGLILTGFYIYGATRATARGDEVNLFMGVLRHHIFGLMILVGMGILLQWRSRRWLRRPWGMGLLAIWIAFNLFTINWQFNLEKPDPDSIPMPPFAPTEITQILTQEMEKDWQENHQLGRIVSGGLLPGGHSAAAVYQLSDLTGNTPLQLARVNKFLEQMPSWRMWQLMNVRYVLDQRDISGEGLSLIYGNNDPQATKLFKMEDPFPRVWAVSQTELIPEDGLALSRLADDNFDLRHTAIIADPLPESLGGTSTSTIDLLDRGPAHLALTVSTESTSLLIISQVYYPGWQATLDGQPIPLRRVNLIQQGVVVPPGDHVLHLSFQSSTFQWGLIISGIGWLLWLIILWNPKRTEKNFLFENN